MAEETGTKRPRRLMKTITGSVVAIEVVGGKKGKVDYDFKKLPPKIQEAFGPFGLSHRLGDSAAGKAGEEAEEAIDKVWSGLMNGEWTVRAPAAGKVNGLKKAQSEFSALTPEQKKAVAASFDKLGIKIPGINA